MLSVLAMQDQRLAAMTPLEKLMVSEELRRSAWQLKAAWIRSQEPSLSDPEVEERVRRIFLDARA